MYTSEDMALFLIALLLFAMVLLFIDWAVEIYTRHEERKMLLESHQGKHPEPKRQGKNYLDEWDEVLDTVKYGSIHHQELEHESTMR